MVDPGKITPTRIRMAADTTTPVKTKDLFIGTPIKDTNTIRTRLVRGTTSLADQGLDPQRLLRGPIAKEILIPPMGRDITPTPTQMGVNTITREMVEALSTRIKTRAMPGARTRPVIGLTILTETALVNTENMIARLS